MDKKALRILKKILGKRICSFTDSKKSYTIFLGEEGYECDCPDFLIRHGSYMIEYDDEVKTRTIPGCKHIAQYLANEGMIGVSKRKRGSCLWEEVEPRNP